MTKSALPNTFTFGNLGCGLISLVMTIQGDYKIACLLIILAGVFDRYDGRIARILGSNSNIGKELDSLADLVSFGVAPSMLIFNLYNLAAYGILGYLLLLVFPLAGAYRLARYNCTEFNGSFQGVPITVAGVLLSLYAFLTRGNATNILLTSILMVLLSYLMISKLPIKKV